MSHLLSDSDLLYPSLLCSEDGGDSGANGRAFSWMGVNFDCNEFIITNKNSCFRTRVDLCSGKHVDVHHRGKMIARVESLLVVTIAASLSAYEPGSTKVEVAWRIDCTTKKGSLREP